MTDVYVVGVGMTNFGRHEVGSGKRLAVEASLRALGDAGLTFDKIDAVYAGTAHPLSPRGVFVAEELGLTGVPVQHLSNASATGLCVAHEAISAIMSGRAETVLAIGYDCPDTEMSTLSVIANERQAPPIVPFALLAARRLQTGAAGEQHLAAIAAKNWNYARNNPHAARRASEPVTAEKVIRSKLAAAPLTAMMCTTWSEGAAAAVFCSGSALKRTQSVPIRAVASVFRTTSHEGGRGGALEEQMAAARLVGTTALSKAGLRPADVDIVQVHDAFAIEEMLYYESLGFSDPDETHLLIERGAFGPSSKQRFGLPEFSTDGGLIARGHPGGPTGLAQIWETARRLRQANSDRVGLCHLIGLGGLSIGQVYARD
ncbi:thiolase family protein [Bradyrhizobium sp. STM 3561]|uniref:thiolase family protein n=1 Tax=Bradyrhizobium sp. STM 3561 TaxID=578923 RepID=UPI00388D73C0